MGEALQGGARGAPQSDGLRRAACRRPRTQALLHMGRGKSSDSLRDVPEGPAATAGEVPGDAGARPCELRIQPRAQGGLRPTGRRGGALQPACDSHAAARFLSHMVLDLGTWAPGPVLVLSPALVVSITRQFLYAQQRRAGKAALSAAR